MKTFVFILVLSAIALLRIDADEVLEKEPSGQHKESPLSPSRAAEVPKTGKDKNLDTPSGRYSQTAKNLVGKKFIDLMAKKKDFLEPGKVVVRCYIEKDGWVQVKSLRVISRQMNAVETDACITAFLTTRFPSFPEDLKPDLKNGLFELEIECEVR